MKKIALVLEGGAMRGIYTAGVLDIFLENNVLVDAVIGVSAGALFGVNYVSNQPKRALRYNKKYAKNKNYMGIYSLLKTGNIMNQDFCFNKLIYDLDPFDFQTFQKSKIKFYATITNLESGEAEYKEIKDLQRDMEYLRASGSMPIVSKIVEIDGEKYLDGGLGDSIPIVAAKKMGYEKIIVVLTRPIEYRKKQSSMVPYKLMYKEYPKFLNTIENRYKNYNKTVEKIIELEKENKIFVIRPSELVKIKRLEKNINRIQKMYDLGYSDAKKRINDLKKFIQQ